MSFNSFHLQLNIIAGSTTDPKSQLDELPASQRWMSWLRGICELPRAPQTMLMQLTWSTTQLNYICHLSSVDPKA